MESYPPTGTADDLLSILAREEFRRTSKLLPPKPRWRRALVEPALNLAARFLYWSARLTPPDRMLAVQDRVYRGLSRGEESPFDPGSAALAQAADLIDRVRRRTGREPALACLLSHPPVMGELVYLNIELLRHALWGLRRLRGRPCRPSVVIAVDRFALDTLPLHEEAMYAGFMGIYHLGNDRLAHSRGRLSRLLMEPASWKSVAARVVRYLNGGGELALVLGGGVPTTSRLLYCAREYLGRLRRLRGPGTPGSVRDRLRGLSPEFAAFSLSDEVGDGLRRSAWRMIEAWFLFLLSRPESLEGADRGELPPSARGALAAVAEALHIPPREAEAAREEFEREFARQTPCRERLFRVLAARVAARGRPLILLPLIHGRQGRVRIEFRPPSAVLSASRRDGIWTLSLLSPDPGGFIERDLEAGAFGREFVSAHYD